MPNPLFNQLGNNAPVNPMLQQLIDFKKSFNGDPKQLVQQMVNSGRISQSQINQYTQQANEIFRKIGDLMK